MIKIAAIVILVIILAAGGLGGAGMMGQGPLAPMFAAKEEAKTAAAEEPPPPPEPKDYYYELGSFVIPVIDKGGISRQIAVDLAIRVVPEHGPRIAADMPRLQNAINFDLYDYLPRRSDPRSPEDRKAVHDRLLKLAIKMYGEAAIRDVIVKSMYAR